MSVNTVIVLRELLKDPALSQRSLSDICQLSLGTVNRVIQRSMDQHYLLRLDEGLHVTEEGLHFLAPYRVKNAIMLAAGFSASTYATPDGRPSGFLKVKGEIMIERQIEQLLDHGIYDISLVVGFQMEAFDYLVDRYGVRLIYNPDYATINNYASLYHARELLDNTYILVADTYIEENFFNLYEATSWYSCAHREGETSDWCVDISARGWIKNIKVGGYDSLAVVGPAYLDHAMSRRLKALLLEYYGRGEATNYYWETILKENFNDFQMKANVQTGRVFEFNHIDEVRAYDLTHFDDLKKKIIAHFPTTTPLDMRDIGKIVPLVDEFGSDLYKFSLQGADYVFRMPDTEDDEMLDYATVAKIYDVLAPLEIAEVLLSYDVTTGVRITEFVDQSYYVDPMNDRDLFDSMQIIRHMHDRTLHVDRVYDIEATINYYEGKVRQTGNMPFQDFEEVKEKMQTLLRIKDRLNVEPVLCHGDYLYTHVIRKKTGGLFVTNWENAGMSDPLLDVAMFGIYSNFDDKRLLLALRFYLGREPEKEEQARLYLYAALGGLLWALWGLQKKRRGASLDDYPSRMYRYMKDYYRRLTEISPELFTDLSYC